MDASAITALWLFSRLLRIGFERAHARRRAKSEILERTGCTIWLASAEKPVYLTAVLAG